MTEQEKAYEAWYAEEYDWVGNKEIARAVWDTAWQAATLAEREAINNIVKQYSEVSGYSRRILDAIRERGGA